MDQFGSRIDEFQNLAIYIWQQGLMGIDFGRIFTALGILVAFLFIRRIFTWFVLSRFESYAKRRGTLISADVMEAIRPPIRFIPVVMGVFFALHYLNLQGDMNVLAVRLGRTLVVFVLFWGIYRLLGPLSSSIEKLRTLLTSAMVDWLVKFLRVAVFAIGVATVLEVWGISIGPVLAGFGLVGVAVALGAQDLFKNLIAGLLILAERRFNIGDWILVDDIAEGTVESIGFRSTLVRRFDKAPVFVPNAQLSDNAVTNFTGMTHRRIYWVIGIEYGTTIDQLRDIRDSIEDYITNNNEFAPPDEVSTFVRIDSLNESSIDMLLYCFTRTTKWGEWLKIKEELAYKVKDIVEGAGAGFSFPSRSLYVHSLPTQKPEVFTPPSDN
ncbi:MAG TPA: mechanosensitive ion channel protein MscS [Rhodospirillaceae bacterium]|nr:mechanosensitive ion channel protein MscS [Candidatus Neomarinimicrobiota bacterium]HCX13897.1 mechanosensitive ion channel protein MscS [Rhodospirillaceae bacterium]